MPQPIATQLGSFSTTGVGTPRAGQVGDHTFTASLLGSGSVSATVLIEVSNDLAGGWTTLATLVLSGTGSAAAQAAATASHAFWRATVSAMTGASLTVAAATEQVTDATALTSLQKSRLLAVLPATESLVSGDTISAKLRACIPGRDAATRFSDVTANAAHLVVEASNTDAFTVDGYFLTKAVADGGLNIPQSAVVWNPATESIILSCVIKRAIPAATDGVFSIGANWSTGYQGFRLFERVTTGLCGIMTYNQSSGILAQSADSTLPISDATPKDRCIVVAFDAPTGSWYVWRDGVLIVSAANLNAPGSGTAFANAISLGDLRIGGVDNVNPGAAVLVQGRYLQFAKHAGPLPTNVGVMAARLAETPGVPISRLEW